MQIFYVPGTDGITCVMDESESRHAVKVLRMTRNDRVNIIDGNGGLYEGIIIDPNPRACRVEITSARKDFEKRDYRLHIAISPLKNNDRFEWFIEKSVEIGVDEITPMKCHNTEKPGVKSDRINNIIVSAMKQSLKAYKPRFNEPAGFNEFVQIPYAGTKMIAHCNPHRERHSIKQICKKNSDVLLLIGPEGDFTEDEIITAEKYGFMPVHLGKSRLRSETAGIAACHAVYFIND